MNKYQPPKHSWDMPELDDFEIFALKSLKEGVASASQQILALQVILLKFAATYDMSFRPGPDGARETDFAEGKRFVGQRIINTIERPMKPVGGKEDAGTSSSDATSPASRTRKNTKPTTGSRKPAKPATGS